MTQKVGTAEIPLCPCFEFRIDYGDKIRGNCSLQRIPRDDNYTLGSCQHEGNARSCLEKEEPAIREKLRTTLKEHAEKITNEGDYFRQLLQQL